MTWPFDDVFEFRNNRYYFCDGNGGAYPLEPGEADRIGLRLSLVLGAQILGFLGWTGFAFFLGSQQFEIAAAPAPGWLVDRSIIYPAAAAYWGFTWLLSCATWGGLSMRFADREVEQGTWPAARNGCLKATRPFPTLSLGLIVYAFVAQGFGDACFMFRGAGYCEIFKFTFS